MNLYCEARRPPTATHPAMTTPPDDERTVRRGVDSPGASPLRALDGGSADALPPKTRLHEFEILSVIHHHDRMLAEWRLLGPGGAVLQTGRSFAIVADDGRLRSITGFFDPAKEARAG